MITPSFHTRNCPSVRRQDWESISGQIGVRRVLSPLCHQCSHLCRWFKFRDNTIISLETTCFVFSQNTGSEVDALDLALAHAHARGKVMAWQNNCEKKARSWLVVCCFRLSSDESIISSLKEPIRSILVSIDQSSVFYSLMYTITSFYATASDAWLERRHFQWSWNQPGLYPRVRGPLSSSKMVSVAFDRKEQHKNHSGMNGILHHSKGTPLYRMGNTARAEIRRLRFLGREALQWRAKVYATSGIQLAKRIRGGRSWNERNQCWSTWEGWHYITVNDSSLFKGTPSLQRNSCLHRSPFSGFLTLDDFKCIHAF